MTDSTVLVNLIKRGGVFYNINGFEFAEIYKNVLETITLPDSLDKQEVLKELCQREQLMSTAVGNGIAIPHPRFPLIKNDEEQCLFVCFLDTPLTVHTPDMRPVFVLFVLLTSNTQTHLRVLSELAFLFQKETFRKILDKKPTEKELIEAIIAIEKE